MTKGTKRQLETADSAEGAQRARVGEPGARAGATGALGKRARDADGAARGETSGERKRSRGEIFVSTANGTYLDSVLVLTLL